MTDGSFTQQDENMMDTDVSMEVEEFSVTLDDGKKFNLNVTQSYSPEKKQISIAKLQADKVASDKIKSDISKSL